MKISRYTKLGILITFSIVVFIWGMNYLKGIDFFKRNTTYHVIYDRIDGLLESSAVMMNGYEVGQVKDISFSDANDGRLLVSFSMEGNFLIPKGSVARIISSDIMGTRSIKLIITDSKEYFQTNDTIPGSVESGLTEQVSMQVLPLKNKAEELLSSLDSAITVITYVFNAETRKNLSESFAHINQTILNLEETSGQLNQLVLSEKGNLQTILKNLAQISTTLSQNSNNFSNIADNLSSISDSIAGSQIKELLTDFSESAAGINEIIEKINTSEGTAGLLINDQALYSNLTSLSSSLDYLLNDLRNNPKRYVHFSAFDLGKNLYITPQSSNESDDSSYIFKLHLISSSSRIDTNSNIFSDFQNIEEVEISGIYNYMAESTSDPNEILNKLDSTKQLFPDASIVAFKNGRQVKLEKALRKSEQHN